MGACAHASNGSLERVSTPTRAVAQGLSFAPSLQAHAAGDVRTLKANGLSSEQISTVLAVKRELSPAALKYLKYAFIPPKGILATFVAKTKTSVDYDAESIVLNDCHSTPHCRHMCGTRLIFASNSLVPLSPSGYTCVQAWYWKTK
jgi:hypothetical protein